MSFKPGDLVMIIEPGIPETNMVGAIKSQCGCIQALVIAVMRGQRVYTVTCSDKCFLERFLKRIDGDRATRKSETGKEVVA